MDIIYKSLPTSPQKFVTKISLSKCRTYPLISANKELHNNNNNNNNNKTQGGKVTILWNQQVRTDRTISNNKPDIIVRDNENRTCILIDVAISADSNVIEKEAEKIVEI